MAFRARFLAGSGAAFLVLVLALMVFASIWRVPGLLATKVVALLFAGAMILFLWQRTRRTNLELAAFLSALDYDDFAETFGQRRQGAGFDDLGKAFDGAMQRLRRDRAAIASETRFVAALLDEAPSALLAISPRGEVELANKAARRLFSGGHSRPIAAFAEYGAELATVLAAIGPGSRRLCRVNVDGLAQRAMLAAATVERQGEVWRIVAVDIIQGELDAAEVAVQIDLVRVLTHEIMNSMTPVTSLAGTAANLMSEADTGENPVVADARIAVDALARRATGILHFVDTYREFSRAPRLTISSFEAQPWIAELVQLFSASPQGETVETRIDVAPPSLRLDVDSDLMGQVVLNLLKNAGEAARAHSNDPRVRVSVSTTASGRAKITVRDNGPGVPPALAEDIFLPFFTTKKSGTGVGLSFARQVVLLHKGTLAILDDALEPGFEILL